MAGEATTFDLLKNPGVPAKSRGSLDGERVRDFAEQLPSMITSSSAALAMVLAAYIAKWGEV